MQTVIGNEWWGKEKSSKGDRMEQGIDILERDGIKSFMEEIKSGG